MNTPINEWRTDPTQNVSNMACINGHCVSGVRAGKYDKHFHDMVCDCKRIKFSWEYCSCDSREILKQKPNNA
jgi:hypothetical protein